MSRELEYIENLYNNMYEATKYLEENKDNIDTSEANQSIAEILEQQNEGLEIVYSIKQAILELDAIKEANPSEALKCVDVLKEDGCITTLYQGKALETIRQSLLKAQEQKEMIVELCEYFGLDDLYPYDDLEKIESALKNARDVSTQQRMELLGKLNKQEKEDAEYKRVLEILKPCLRLVNNFLQARIPLLDIDRWVIVKEITDEKEHDLLKRWIEK